MAYAGHHVLREAYQGHYATVAAHSERWGQFAKWAKEQGIKDARDVTTEIVIQYGQGLADQVAQEKVSVPYAQNLVSSINVVLETLRGDRAIRVSPSAVIGEQRTNVRDSAPASMDREKVARTVADLRYQGFERQAVVLEVARDLGLRAKEAVMMDYRSAIREAGKTGFVDVREGTKGGRGREVERLVPVSDRAMQTLQRGAVLQVELGGRNLIAPGENWKSVTDALRTEPVREIMQDHNMKMYHDARAAYACDRYQQITGHPAPAVAGQREADKPADRLARQVIGGELGHGRPDVLVSYVGSAK
jgi:hypothetical protein